MKYYKIFSDMTSADKWWLGECSFPDEDDIWDYVKAGKVTSPPNNLVVEMKEKGRPLDFTMADLDLFIVNQRAANVFDPNDIQLIPVSVAGYKGKDQHFILVILFEEDCVDEKRSDFKKYEVDDYVRPDLAGEYSGIAKFVIDHSKIYKHSIFRVKAFDVAVIVNEVVKEKFIAQGLTGLEFIDIN